MAARLMCADVPRPRGNSEVTILCDQACYEAGSDWFQFQPAASAVYLKGFTTKVSFFWVLGELAAGQSKGAKEEAANIVGRSQEVNFLRDLIVRWSEGGQRESVLITGRSGFGKTTLLTCVKEMIEKSPNVIFCSCVGDEMKRNSSLGVFKAVVNGLIAQMRLAGISSESFEATAGVDNMSIRRQSFSRPYSAYSEQAYDPDWAYLASILEALGVPQGAGLSTIAAIPGLGKVDGFSTVASDGDICTRLAILLCRLIKALETISFRVCLLWDDAQWLDRESLLTMVRLSQYCPQALFVVVARTKEEWDRLDDFDLVQLQCNEFLPLSPLTLREVREMLQRTVPHADVGDKVLKQVMARSNGVPVAVKMLANSLKVKSAVSRPRSDSFSWIPMTAGGAIAAQLDTLSQKFRHILSVASVMGQYFLLEDLMGVLELMGDISESECNVESLEELIARSDRFGFLIRQKDESNQSYSFSHCMIQHGVLASLLPNKKEAIHLAIVHFYHKRLELEPDDDSKLLPAIVAHLVKVSGHLELKRHFLYRGFVTSAEYRKEAETLYYRDLLLSLDPNFFESLSLSDQIKSCRLLVNMHFQLGDASGACSVAFAFLRRMGHPVYLSTTDKLAFLRSFLYHRRFTQRLIKGKSVDARSIGFDYLARNFPVVFPVRLPRSRSRRNQWQNPNRIRNRDSSSMITLDCLVGDGFGPGEGQRRLKELVQIVDLMADIFYEGRMPGMNHIVFQMSSILMSHAGGDTEEEALDWRWRIKLGLCRVATLMLAEKIVKKAQIFQKMADVIPDNAEYAWELRCKAYWQVLEVVQSMFYGHPVDMATVMKMRESVDLAKEAGLELDESILTPLVSWHTFMTINGVSAHRTPDGRTVSIEQHVQMFKQTSATRRKLFSAEMCRAADLAIQCNIEEAQEIIFEYSDYILETTSTKSRQISPS
ncbi:AAA ATPase domain-containing protein [Zopfochytrium polystomum]|nr:AAA ATPase domain-containing protein [Zopfochytrium polystomum]